MKTMPGAHDEGSRDNPAVRSKFDKSHGKGLPAPHLKHPGEVAPETGSHVPGHNENGHRLPVERSVGLGGVYQRAHYTPGEMGAPMLHGTGQGVAKNTRLTDGNVVKSSHEVGLSRMHHPEPDPVHAGSDKHSKQHSTGTAAVRAKPGGHQKMEDSSKRTSAPYGTLNRDHMKGRS